MFLFKKMSIFVLQGKLMTFNIHTEKFSNYSLNYITMGHTLKMLKPIVPFKTQKE